MTEQPQPAPPPEERPFWNLNRDDQRVLWITFVGGVASIIAGFIVVAVAVAVARAEQTHRTAAIEVFDWLTIVGTVAGGIFAFLTVSRKPTQSRVRRWARWIAAGVAIASLGITLLALIGVGAGVK